MPDITASMVKELRDATNVSMMECKKALVQTEGDMEAAVKLLRERGIAVAAKRASKEANQGVVVSASTEDGRTMSLVEVNCETDFVARNEGFQAFAASIAQAALTTDDVADELNEELLAKIAEIGENMKIRRGIRFELAQTGRLTSYIHMGGKVGVLLELGCEKEETVDSDDFKEVGKDLTLHIAACSPRYLASDEIPEEEISAEREIYAKQVEDKPAQIIDKIVDGKLRKFVAEICLIDQGFVKEPKQAVRELLDEKGKALDDTLTILRFVRYKLGE